jgi:hypothetical protein
VDDVAWGGPHGGVAWRHGGGVRGTAGCAAASTAAGAVPHGGRGGAGGVGGAAGRRGEHRGGTEVGDGRGGADKRERAREKERTERETTDGGFKNTIFGGRVRGRQK